MFTGCHAGGADPVAIVAEQVGAAVFVAKINPPRPAFLEPDQQVRAGRSETGGDEQPRPAKGRAAVPVELLFERPAAQCLSGLQTQPAAEDFGVALHILSMDLDIRTQDDYDRVREGLGARWLGQFHQQFYRTRHRLRTDDLGRWLRFHRTYPAFIEVLERCQQRANLAIATAKDGESVRQLLRHFGIDHLFSDDLILDKETGIAKTAHLKILATRIRCETAQITFVDDKLNHLEATAGLGVRGVLAGWGHNTQREHKLAQEAGFAVATLETAEALLFRD